jgi:hypothetical protein
MAPRDGGSAVGAPAASLDQVLGMINQLQQENATLREQIESRGSGGTNGPRLRYPEPPTFDGKKEELSGFLTHVKAYHLFYGRDLVMEADKVFSAAAFLRGNALAWFEPIQRDYLDQKEEVQDELTKKVFGRFAYFEMKLRETFGDPDEDRTCEQQLRNLRQKGSTAEYTTKFRQITSRLGWDDEPLMAAYYAGLKDDVKDELVKMDRPKQFDSYVAAAIKIDNRQYERRMERRGQNPVRINQTYKANTGQRRGNAFVPSRPRNIAYAHTTNPGPMELGNLQKGPKKDLKDVKCYNCDKNGHYARDCRQAKRLKDARQLNVMTREDPPNPQHISTHVEERVLSIHTLTWNMTRRHQGPYEPYLARTAQEIADIANFMEDCNQRIREGDKKAEREKERLKEHMRKEDESYLSWHSRERKGRGRFERFCERLHQDPKETETLATVPEQEEGIATRTLAVMGRSGYNDTKAAYRTLAVLGRDKPPKKELRWAPNDYRTDSDQQADATDEDENDSHTLSNEEDEPMGQTHALEHYRREYNALVARYEETASDGDEYDQRAMEEGIPLEGIEDLDKHGEFDLPGLRKTDARQARTSYRTESARWNDDENSRPESDKHMEIFWGFCVYDDCPKHLLVKVQNDFFPRRQNNGSVSNTPHDSDFPHWTMTLYKEGRGFFHPDPHYPPECVEKEIAWYDCRVDRCKVHAIQKATEWRLLWEGEFSMEANIDYLMTIAPQNPDNVLRFHRIHPPHQHHKVSHARDYEYEGDYEPEPLPRKTKAHKKDKRHSKNEKRRS